MKALKRYLIEKKRPVRNLCVFVILYFGANMSYAGDLLLTVDEWPPYIEKQTATNGFVSDIVRRALDASGVPVKLEFKPWKRVESEIDAGIAISYGWIKTNQREEKWLYSDALFIGMSVFASLQDIDADSPPNIDDLSTLSGYAIGVTRGYSYGDLFDRRKADLDIKIVSTDVQNLGMLIKKRIDYFVVDHAVGQWLLEEKFAINDREKVKFYTDKPLIEYSLHMVCSKKMTKCRDYIDQINEGLNLLKPSVD